MKLTSIILMATLFTFASISAETQQSVLKSNGFRRRRAKNL